MFCSELEHWMYGYNVFTDERPGEGGGRPRQHDTVL